MGLESKFKGIIDVIEEKAIYFDGSYGYTFFKISKIYITEQATT